MQLEALAAAIDGLVACDETHFADADSIAQLQRQKARLDALTARQVAAFDSSGGWAPDGAQSCTAWLTARCRLPRRDAAAQVRAGRHLRDLPCFAGAWLGGEVNAAHVELVAAARTPVTAEALARDEEMLLDQAKSLRLPHFARVLRYWEQLADPDGVEVDAEARRAGRGAWLSPSFGGSWFGKFTLDPISGAIVGGELDRLTEQLFERDWADARERLGREPTTQDLGRTPAQRRADALVEMATRSRSTPAGSRRPAPLFSVLVGYETLRGRICELAEGIVLSPGSLVGWLTEVDIERAVFGPGNRVDVSAATRLFSGATRRAIEIRDRTCTHPFCDRPALRCEVDHIVPWSEGGATTQENGRLLCTFHNRLRIGRNQRPPPHAA